MRKVASQVLIAGCGPVGLTLANCLVRSPLVDAVTLLDRKIPFASRQLPPLASQRVYSINGPSLQLYSSLGVLPLIRQKGLMSKVQVVSKQSLSFLNWEDNQANVIENDELVNALMRNLQDGQFSSKINYIEDEVAAIERHEEDCTVRLKAGKEQIQTQLVVGSDGITSNIKKLAGIPHYGWQYRQKAIVCTMRIDPTHDNTSAYQIYHDGNVLAILPLWDNYVSLVWSLALPDFEHLISIPDQQFRQKLNNVIINSNRHLSGQQGYRQTPQIVQIVNKRLSFPLSTMQSGFYSQQRVALIGDAAHTIHPMAGLGVNSGIMDSILLANNVIKNLRTGNDIGDHIALADYEARAKAFNYANSIGMETIKKLFQFENPFMNPLRKLGLAAVQNSAAVKEVMKNLANDKSLKYEWEA